MASRAGHFAAPLCALREAGRERGFAFIARLRGPEMGAGLRVCPCSEICSGRSRPAGLCVRTRARGEVVGEVAQVGSACTFLLVDHDALDQGALDHAVQVEVVQSLPEILQGELVELRADNDAGVDQRHR